MTTAFRLFFNNNAKAGKEYYLKLEEGATFRYATAAGEVRTAKKITPNYVKNGKLYKSAACELLRKVKGGSTKKRFPKFKSVIVD